MVRRIVRYTAQAFWANSVLLEDNGLRRCGGVGQVGPGRAVPGLREAHLRDPLPRRSVILRAYLIGVRC